MNSLIFVTILLSSVVGFASASFAEESVATEVRAPDEVKDKTADKVTAKRKPVREKVEVKTKEEVVETPSVKKVIKTTVETKTETIEVKKEEVKEPSLGEKSEAVMEKTKEVAIETTEKVTTELAETRIRREQSDYFALLNYSPLDLLIPSKIGGTLGIITKEGTKSWELEYLRGKMSVPFIIEDLGSLTDEKISLIRRSYGASNSFNFSYGLTYFNLNLHIGDKLLNKISGSYPNYDIIDITALGFNLGLGNRWVFKKNITFGVDWFTWSQPVYVMNKKSAFLDYATDPDDRDDVETAIKVMSYFPRLTFLKIQLGMSF